MLQRSSGLVRLAIEREEARLRETQLVMTEVHSVLEEMVYDVEAFEHECELDRLRRELRVAESSVQELQQRESELVQERQEVFEFAAKVEQDGRQIVARLNENMAIVLEELSKKDVVEKELEQARNQLIQTAQLSKELASAQREIRDLRRTNSIQHLLKTSPLTAGARAQPYRNGRSEPAAPQSAPARAHTVREASGLDALPDKLLMRSFAYLDANSVFAVSLTNHGLMTRVNTMFGMPTILPPQTRKSAQKSPASSRTSIPRSVSRSKSEIHVSPAEKEKMSKVEMIVKSLKKEEMKLFHDMSTRVKALEGHLVQVQAEKEDIAARLYGAENVRDFLMEKLKELEDTLSATMDLSTKKDEQAAMDREIMGFLDAKNQEYELALTEYALQNAALRTEMEKMREDQASKMRIVQDMVDLLAEEKKDLEVQLRSQRKVLVREVKGLRAQNEQLVGEKEQYFAQLKQLKHALHHLDELP